MKKFFKVVLLLFFPMYITYGQTHQDSVSTYNKLNKWAVVKLTIAYMEDLGMNQENEIQTYNNLKSKYKTYSDNVDLGSFEEYLTHGWTTTKTKVYGKYKNELVDTEARLDFKSNFFKPAGKENSREKVLFLINKTYDSILQLNIKPSNVEEHPGNTRVAIKGPDQPVVNKGINLFNILLYFILAISILLNIIFYSKNKSPMKKQNSGKVGEFDDFYKTENEALKGEINKLKNDNNDLKPTIKKNNDKPISELNKNEDIVSEEKPFEDEISPTVSLNAKQVQNPQKTIYLPSPFEELKFAVEDVSENDKPTSLYVAKIDSKTNKGTISLIETANLSRALNSPDLFLETVCDYENPYSASAKGIKVINKGEISLEGEDWVVKKKIKIKFI